VGPERASGDRSRGTNYRPLLPEYNWLFFGL
jgi:hypothetical protein